MDLAMVHRSRVGRAENSSSTGAAEVHHELEMLCPPETPDRAKRIERTLAKVLMLIMDRKNTATQ
jgi:hypothetical protein